jgi:GT2 family glycosyltransferase
VTAAGAGPEAAVIIPHFNDVERLTRCLDALMPMLARLDPGRVEVVVVDNGSTQPLDAVRGAHPGLRLVTEPAKGAAMARNRGVVETSAPLIFFLDCDCVPAPDWLETALRVADRGDLVGGRVTLFDETPPPRSGAEAFETVFAFDNRAYIERDGFSVTANLLTRREVFTAVGPLIAGMSEDIEWCRRATGRGYSLVYAPELCVAHPTRADWPALRRKLRRLTQEVFVVSGTGPAARARWGLKALAMPVSILAHAPRVLTHPALHGAGERLAGLAMLVRVRLLRAGWMLGQALTGRP